MDWELVPEAVSKMLYECRNENVFVQQDLNSGNIHSPPRERYNIGDVRSEILQDLVTF